MVQRFENLDLFYPALMEVATSILLQRLHCHKLAGAVIGWVIKVQHHLSKVALEMECIKTEIYEKKKKNSTTSEGPSF